MSDGEVGYGKPPKHSRFRKGVCPNRKGRGRRERYPIAEAAEAVLQAKVSYRESGRVKRAARLELSIRRLFTSALNGNVKDAVQLLKIRQDATQTDTVPMIIRVTGGLPDEFSKRAVDDT